MSKCAFCNGLFKKIHFCDIVKEIDRNMGSWLIICCFFMRVRSERVSFYYPFNEK